MPEDVRNAIISAGADFTLDRPCSTNMLRAAVRFLLEPDKRQ
jgi:DNA-binding response OmpR family regulator